VKVIYYVIVGAPLVATVAFALAEIAAPVAFIRWRQRVTAEDAGVKASLRDWFDNRLGTGGAAPWQDPVVVRRVRLFGTGLLTVALITGYVFLILLPRSL
jgi:hypothetical protein